MAEEGIGEVVALWHTHHEKNLRHTSPTLNTLEAAQKIFNPSTNKFSNLLTTPNRKIIY
jgi:hypothetical protein